MKYLTNLTTYKYDMDRFGQDWERINAFIGENGLDALELMLYKDYDLDKIPKKSVMGIHLRYWFMWLDFWRGNHEALHDLIGSEEDIAAFYGGHDRNAMSDHYKWELEAAKKLEVKYMVFHVAHVELLHAYTRDFTYSDREVLEATAELVNAAFGDRDEGVTLLFENLWWPGLRLTDAELVASFLDKIHYPNKGIMLDIGHLSATNSKVHTEEDACRYILSTVRGLGELKKYIKGIHLNKSLPGDYLTQDHKDKIEVLESKTGFWDKISWVREHILNIDWHIPFDSPLILEVIEEINPEYLVFEVLGKSLEEVESMLKVQRGVFNI